jgi:DNA polymerase III alpha subunit (gram-positive type)
MLREDQIFIVVDIEADGPAPGLHSMLSIGAIATTESAEVSHFYATLKPLPDCTPDSDTMEWWESQPEAWQEVNSNTRPAETVIKDFYDWVNSLEKEPIFVASPIGLDYSFVSWYLARFAPSNPFMDSKNNGIRSLDLRSFIAGKYGFEYDQSTRANLPDRLKQIVSGHTHKAIDDAIGYGALLRKALQD